MVDCIVLLSGKRKSGKDYFSARLMKAFEESYPELTIEEIRLSGPLKETYAKEHNLDYQLLLSADSYKEEHRQSMITFGEDKRNQDSGYWCRAATKDSIAKIWIVVDCRRETDVAYFVNTYPGKTISIRIQAEEPVRVSRGFKFTIGVDDFPSECGLDNYNQWNYTIDNNNNPNDFDLMLEILRHIRNYS